MARLLHSSHASSEGTEMRLNHSVPWNDEMKREIERWENEGGRVSLIPTWREPVDPDAANTGPGLRAENCAAAERQITERNAGIGKQPVSDSGATARTVNAVGNLEGSRARGSSGARGSVEKSHTLEQRGLRNERVNFLSELLRDPEKVARLLRAACTPSIESEREAGENGFLCYRVLTGRDLSE